MVSFSHNLIDFFIWFKGALDKYNIYLYTEMLETFIFL